MLDGFRAVVDLAHNEVYIPKDARRVKFDLTKLALDEDSHGFKVGDYHLVQTGESKDDFIFYRNSLDTGRVSANRNPGYLLDFALGGNAEMKAVILNLGVPQEVVDVVAFDGIQNDYNARLLEYMRESPEESQRFSDFSFLDELAERKH